MRGTWHHQTDQHPQSRSSGGWADVEAEAPLDGSLENTSRESAKEGIDDASVRLQHEGLSGNRSLQLLNLPESVTYADITDVVRGGQLLNLVLRSRDNSAIISFVHPEAATAFFDHVRRYDLYIKNKRVGPHGPRLVSSH